MTDFRVATPAENLRILLIRHADVFSIAERQEVAEAAAALESSKLPPDYWEKRRDAVDALESAGELPEVCRYDLASAEGDYDARMEPTFGGDYVRSEDYDTLRASHTALAARLKEANTSVLADFAIDSQLATDKGEG